MATTYKYVVNKDWDTQQKGDIVQFEGCSQFFTFAPEAIVEEGSYGFASIYETIHDANGIAVAGAVGTPTTQTVPTPYATSYVNIDIVNGKFDEDVVMLGGAQYTLSFRSIYGDFEHLTSFVGSITPEMDGDNALASNVNIRVTGGVDAETADDTFTSVVLFGAPAEYDITYKTDTDGNFLDANDQIIDPADDDKKVILSKEITNRTTITLNKMTAVAKSDDYDFIVGGDFLSDYTDAEKTAKAFANATAVVVNTDLTASNRGIWVGSGWDSATDVAADQFELAADHKQRFKLVILDSNVETTGLVVRNTGYLGIVGSTVNADIANFRNDVDVFGSTFTLTNSSESNIYGETGTAQIDTTATLTLTNSQFNTTNSFAIGKAGVAERKGEVVLVGSQIGYVIPDDTTTVDNEFQIVRSGDFTVNTSGTLTMDADSQIYATNLTNNGILNIEVDADGEDWINVTKFTNNPATAATKNIVITGSISDGVKRVIYSQDKPETGYGSVAVDNVDVTGVNAGGSSVSIATRKGKLAIAAGIDYKTIYVSNSIDEEDDFAKEVHSTEVIPDTDPVKYKSYYVDFNAFQLPKSTLEEGVKDETKTILIDGTDRDHLDYVGTTTASIDGLTFAKDGTNAVEATDVEKNVVFTLSGMVASDPASYRALAKGITVEEGVTFTADKLYQSGKNAVTTINGELAMAANDTFQIAGGEVNVNGSLTGAGIVSVIATLREGGTPIPAALNVTGAPISLNKLEIGANSTVTLKDIAANDDEEHTSKAVFNNIVMRKTNVQDFDAPVLNIFNSQITVTDSLDLGAKLPTDPDTIKLGTVNIDFQSKLYVLTQSGTIEGGNLNLHVTQADKDLLNSGEAQLFYTIVHGKLASAVNLTCDGDLDGDDDHYIDGTKYIYTSLEDKTTHIGQGLFVMHEDVAKNIYVNAAWINKKIGEVVGDGMFYGINAFETFTGALSAATKRANATSITLLSDVTEDNLESMSYKLQNAVTVKGSYTVVWNVTTQTQDDGSVYFFGDKDKTSEKLTFEAGTTYQAAGTGPIYIGYDPANDNGPENRMDAEFNGTIQTSAVYVGRWSNLTVNGTITNGGWIYLRKHSKILIDGTGRTWTKDDPQVSTSSARIYGGTTTVLNSVVKITGALSVINRNVTGEADYNMPAETNVFAATNSTIYANSFSGNKVDSGDADHSDLKDSVTSLVKSTMTITNGVNNFGTIYVGVAVKAKDITEGETIVKNTVEVDDTVTDAASTLSAGSITNNAGGTIAVANGSELLVGTTVSNAGVITFTGKTTTELVESENPDDPNGDPIVTEQEVVVRSTANITGELKNNAGGVITITDSTVNTSKVTNSATTDYGTINVNANGVLNVTTAGGLNNGGYGIMNVTGGTVSATHNSAAFWNYGIMNLNGAEFAFHDNIIRNSNVINVNGAVNVHDENNAMGKILANNANAKVVFGVSNTGDDAAEVKTNIQGGKVAFSADGLSFDWAVTGVSAEATADEAIASAKLKGGTLFVDKEDITLFDTGFKVVDTAAVADDPDQEGDQSVAEVSHMVWNNTNAIEIGATGELTLDKGAGDYLNPKKWSITGLKTTAGGSLTMHWTSVLTVSSLDNVGAETITIDVSGFNGIIEGDKLLIDQDNTQLDMAFYEGIMTNPKGWFKIGTGTNAGDLFLNAAAFAKVSQSHTPDIDNGWYNHVNNQGTGSAAADLGAADSESPVVLVLDGKFDEGAYLNSKETYVVGGTPDPEHEGQDLELSFSKIFAGGYDVSTLKRSYGPAQLNLKVVDGNLGAEEPTYDDDGNASTLDTDVTISAGTFSNFVIGGDVVRLAAGEDKVNFFRLGDTNLTINGGTFEVAATKLVDNETVLADNEKQIVGGLYFYKAGGGFATITGDVNLTISGGTFYGYNVYGGNFANTKTLGKNTRIDGDVNLTLNSSEQALVFAKNRGVGKKGGLLYGGSFGAGTITGDVTVTLTGDEDIAFEKLFGGSTGDIRKSTGELESNVEGNRILSFTGFTGDILGLAQGKAAVIEGFDTVEISGVNELNFDVTGTNFNLDVTSWKFAADAEVSGTFAFDFTGDTVDMTALTSGIVLNNVTMTQADLANVSVAAGLTKSYEIVEGVGILTIA